MRERENNKLLDEPQEKCWFDEIYQAALEKNIERINFILENDGCIDEYKKGILTPAGKLASEGNKEAVEFLIQFGANVNAIGFGAALGRKKDLAEFLYARHGANINELAAGAAATGDREYAEYCRKHRGAHSDFIAWGAELGGDNFYAEELFNDHKADVKQLARGAAFRGDEKRTEYWQRESIIDETAYNAMLGGNEKLASNLAKLRIHILAKSLARAGFTRKSYSLFIKVRKPSANEMAMEAALGGFKSYSEFLRTKKLAQAEDISFNAAQTGHFRYALELIKLDNKKISIKVAMGAAYGCHFRFCSELYEKFHFDINCIVPNTISSQAFSSPDSALHALSFIPNASFRSNLAYKIQLSDKINYNLNELAIKASHINSYMIYNLNYNECLAWMNSKELRTLIIFFRDSFIKKISSDIFLYIASFYSTLTHTDNKNLLNKITFIINLRFLMNDFETYSSWTNIFNRLHKERANSLLSVVRLEREPNQVLSLLKNQIRLFNTKDEKKPANSKQPKHEQPVITPNQNEGFYQIIIKNYRRFSLFTFPIQHEKNMELLCSSRRMVRMTLDLNKVS